MRCDRCGKFRKAGHVATSDHGDEATEMVIECRWCMSPVDRERFGLPVEGESKP